MDKIIKSIKKVIQFDSAKEEKKLTNLEKADKKRDKICDLGKMVKKAASAKKVATAAQQLKIAARKKK